MANAYRSSMADKVGVAYRELSDDEKQALASDQLTLEQAAGIEQRLQRHNLTLQESYATLSRCVFEAKTAVLKEETAKTAVDPEKKDNAYGFLFVKRESVKGSLMSPVGGISLAQKVEGDQCNPLGAAFNYAHSVDDDQGTFFGVAFNYAHSVRSQGAVFGAAFNYAHSVSGSQGAFCGVAFNYAHSVSGSQGAFCGVAFNYAHSVDEDQAAIFGAVNIAHEVVGSQFAALGLAINIAKRVGNNQVGMVNVATEEIKGYQIGIVNYANGAEYRQYGLLNLRAGERSWLPGISLFYHDARKRERKKAEKELRRIVSGLEEMVDEPVRAAVVDTDSDKVAMEEAEQSHLRGLVLKRTNR